MLLNGYEELSWITFAWSKTYNCEIGEYGIDQTICLLLQAKVIQDNNSKPFNIIFY